MTPEQWSRIQYFTPRELACRCCGLERMSFDFMLRLDGARRILGRPIAITSGSRCPARNAAVGGSPTSSHLFDEAKGIESGAVDVGDGHDPVQRGQLIEACQAAGLRQFEVSRDGHLHIMDDPRKPRPFLGIEP